MLSLGQAAERSRIASFELPGVDLSDLNTTERHGVKAFAVSLWDARNRWAIQQAKRNADDLKTVRDWRDRHDR